MILSEEKLEQLVCSQLSINREEAYLFTAKFGFIIRCGSEKLNKGSRSVTLPVRLKALNSLFCPKACLITTRR